MPATIERHSILSENDQENARQFISGGSGIFTADNGQGTHFTYKISRPKDKQTGKPLDVYFVGLVAGPDNNSDYQYLGMFDPTNGSVRLTAKSRASDDAQSVKVLRWVLAMIWNDRQFPEGYDVLHEGRCGICGRRLTVPESIKNGIGPICMAR
tara:strand:+ start:981 stop:1442 length:462 start_codon:yes stop_codon:yes gene_type:complete